MFGLDAGLLLVGCGLLCVGVIVFGFIFPLLDLVFDVIGTLVGFIFDIAGVGPVPGCGCVILLLLVGGCGVFGIWFTDAMATCGTPEQVNLCRLF